MQEPEDSPRHWCYGCGDRNPEGLHIVFEVDGRRVSGRFQPRETHRGWPDFAHGGVAAAALDEELVVSAEVTRDRGRRLEAEASIRTQSGETLAQASGVFIRVPAERARELEALFRGEAQPNGLEKDDIPSRSS